MAYAHLLGIPDLHPDAFRPVAGRMRLYGKSDAPAAPDYVGQANATAAGNLNAARSQTAANRIDQVTPYGSIKYTQGDGFDEDAYNMAVERYHQLNSALDDNPNGIQMRQYLSAIGQSPSAPNRSDFIKNPDHWSSSIELSETGKQLLDAYNQASLGLAGLQGQAMDRVRSTLSSPFESGGMAAWDKAANLIKNRNRDSLNQQQAALDTKLANMGLTPGSEGWQIQQQQFAKQRNDADMAAELAGGQMSNQVFQQDLAARMVPLNELNALRSGSQVTNPTFFNPGNQSQTSGPDLLGASQGQYNAQMNQVNAQNAQAAGTAQAGTSLATAAMLAYFY